MQEEQFTKVLLPNTTVDVILQGFWTTLEYEIIGTLSPIFDNQGYHIVEQPFSAQVIELYVLL